MKTSPGTNDDTVTTTILLRSELSSCAELPYWKCTGTWNGNVSYIDAATLYWFFSNYILIKKQELININGCTFYVTPLKLKTTS